ncbi:glycosyltransferase [Enterococcus casseliflavus]|uniref:glycosyltransferase n=1 Tax=Enterococcus casseliflavus TaxID=37734 RepID=UPI0034D354AB
MKGTVFLANINYSESSGIFKKIYAQSKVISNDSSCFLVCKKEENIFILHFVNGEILNEETTEIIPTVKNLIRISKNIIKENPIDRLYFRNTLKPTLKQVMLFRFARKNGLKVFYEVPTYPYFGEQINSSTNKILTFFKLVYDKIIFYASYLFIDKVIVVISNTSVRLKKKFVEITNGVEIDSFNINMNHNLNPIKKLTFIGVGTLYNYHGYSRLIKSIKKYNEQNKNCNITFEIVGDGPAIKALKKDVENLRMENIVRFHGKVYGESLDLIFSKADIGVGALALYKRDADIDTTLKVVEYISRGLPVLTSGIVRGVNFEDMIFHVENSSKDIDMSHIIHAYIHFRETSTMTILEENRKSYDWKTIMEKALI